jgi:hypothetical protein
MGSRHWAAGRDDRVTTTVTRRRSEKVSGLTAGVLTDPGQESGSTIERG